MREASKELSDEDQECHGKLFSCPDDGCIKSFQRFSSLQHHLDVGRHSYALENETLFDKAMISYATKLEQGNAIVENPIEDIEACQAFNSCSSLPMGWALKSANIQRARLSESQKQYLTEVFQIGERTGHKANPSNVSKSMRKARNADGSFKFGAASYLRSKQVASFFSRLAAKRVAAADEPQDEETEHQEEMDMIQEHSIEELSEKVVEEISIQHPVMYDTHNICELGWALKSANIQRARLSESQKQYLTEVFQIGERTGHKADPSNVSKSMRKARNADGSFKFGAASYLTSI